MAFRGRVKAATGIGLMRASTASSSTFALFGFGGECDDDRAKRKVCLARSKQCG
jgi:hypothetical protein